MSDPTNNPVTTPGAQHPLNGGPVHPLVLAVRLDAVEDILNQASVLIERGFLAAAVDRVGAALATARELDAASGGKIAATGVLMTLTTTAVSVEDARALDRIRTAQRTLAGLAREFRQESDRLEHEVRAEAACALETAEATQRRLPPVRGDEAVMADLRRERSVLDDCFRDHQHTPTDHMPSMRPISQFRGYEGHEARERAARKAARALRWRSFVGGLPRRVGRLVFWVAVVVVVVRLQPVLADVLAPVDRAVAGFLGRVGVR